MTGSALGHVGLALRSAVASVLFKVMKYGPGVLTFSLKVINVSIKLDRINL